jgi:hypothetical protein
MKFRNLKAEEIDVRVGNCFSWGYTLLLYKDARCDMNILDETLGAENWQRDHKEVKGNLYCGVGVWNEKTAQWIWKWDCGVESNTEKEKGEASDSFKRACVNVGIGRELYTSPQIKVSCEMEQNGKGYTLPKNEKNRRFKVKEIAYNDNKEIIKLVIVDNKNVQVFPANNVENTLKQQIQGGSFVLTGGKHDGKTINEVLEIDEDYIKFCILNAKNFNIKQNMIKAWEDSGRTPIEVEV